MDSSEDLSITPPAPPAPKAAKKAAKKAAAKKPKKKVAKVAKKAPKKTDKKVAAKKIAQRVANDPSELGDALDAMQVGLSGLVVSRNKTPLSFKRMSDVRREFMRFNNLSLERLFGMCGIPHGTLGEIIGPESSGKTTLCFTLMGLALKYYCPCLYISTENKPPGTERAMRMLSTDPVEAATMLRRITMHETHTLKESVDTMDVWIDYVRNKAPIVIPITTPIVVVIDTWSKLMNDAEANGFVEHPDFMEAKAKKKLKEVGEAAKMGHAAFAQAWCRRLPHMHEKYNLILILVGHQNVSVVMAQPGQKAPPPKSAMHNKTRIGGKAFDQNSAWQLIVAKGEQWKDTSTGGVIGNVIRARMEKNSYGPQGRTAEWNLRNEVPVDTSAYLDPAIHFYIFFMKYMAEMKLLDVEVRSGRIHSPILGVMGVTYREAWLALQMRPDLIEKLGSQMQIYGYKSDLDSAADKGELTPAPNTHLPGLPQLPAGTIPPPPVVPPFDVKSVIETALATGMIPDILPGVDLDADEEEEEESDEDTEQSGEF